MVTQQIDRMPSEHAPPSVKEVLNQEWLAAGVSQEELDQEEEVTNIFDRLAGSGCSMDIIYAAWNADYTGYKDPALALYLRLLAIAERVLPADDPMLAQILYSLATHYQTSDNLSAAEPLYARVLTLREQTFGAQNPLTLQAREAYVALLCAEDRQAEADRMQTGLLVV